MVIYKSVWESDALKLKAEVKKCLILFSVFFLVLEKVCLILELELVTDNDDDDDAAFGCHDFLRMFSGWHVSGDGADDRREKGRERDSRVCMGAVCVVWPDEGTSRELILCVCDV